MSGGQEARLATAARLWAAGFTADVHVLAVAVEQAAEDIRGQPAHERAARAGAERRLSGMTGPPRQGWSLFRKTSS